MKIEVETTETWGVEWHEDRALVQRPGLRDLAVYHERQIPETWPEKAKQAAHRLIQANRALEDWETRNQVTGEIGAMRVVGDYLVIRWSYDVVAKSREHLQSIGGRESQRRLEYLDRHARRDPVVKERNQIYGQRRLVEPVPSELAGRRYRVTFEDLGPSE